MVLPHLGGQQLRMTLHKGQWTVEGAVEHYNKTTGSIITKINFMTRDRAATIVQRSWRARSEML